MEPLKKLEESKKLFATHAKQLQEKIIDELQKVDPYLKIKRDLWQRKDHIGNDGGGGLTVSLKGEIIENGGVNTSQIYGQLSPEFAKKLGSTSTELWATGLSLIIHPLSPKIPTVHANFRMIHTGDKFWFGGGADLTPYYPHTEDFYLFHRTWYDACSPYGVYKDMKQQCDDYFCNHHRDGEMRGIGGIFFDHHNTKNLEKDLQMCLDLSEHFIPSYFPIVNKRINEKWNKKDEDFQLHRRGRYVEFNLLHDRGTLFGLKSNGRTDSILISLPARCHYTYCYQPDSNSPHEKMMEYYKPKDWINS